MNQHLYRAGVFLGVVGMALLAIAVADWLFYQGFVTSLVLR